MPYDERLSSIGRVGTRVEFAQRALLHFVQNVAKDKGTLQSDRAEVLRLLSQAKTTASKRTQKRINDNEVRHLIQRLRDTLDHAVEQSPAHGRDWFGMGGILIKDEDKPLAKKLRKDFFGRWEIDYPLHSAEIRGQNEAFVG